MAEISNYVSPQQVKAKKALERLSALPGMGPIKDQVEQMIQFARVSKIRKQQGLRVDKLANHMVFTGNPGTGKTTAARLIGKAYAAMGLLKTDQDEIPFVEVHHSDVTHPHVGQAERTIKALFKDARGGVLFIDEAYAFIAGESTHGTGDKVIAAIVQLMEDMREEIMVIAAGYPEDMDAFLDSNPGLRSRFTSTIHFHDYSVRDLVAIAQSLCGERDYVPSAEYLDHLARHLFEIRMKPGFGNGRTVRNIVEQSIRMQSVRLSNIPNPSRNDLSLLLDTDLVIGQQNPPKEREYLLKLIHEINGRLLELDLKEILAKKPT